MADLAAAADGTLHAGRARPSSRRMAAQDDRSWPPRSSEQRRAVTLIRGAAAEIRGAARAARAPRGRSRPPGRAPRARRRWLSVALAGAAAAAVLLAVVLAAPGGADASRTPPRSPRQPATGAGARRERPAARRSTQDGVAVPRLGREVRLGGDRHATPARSTAATATTVYYEKDGNTLAYTIVGGDALDVPDGTTTIEAEGTAVDIFGADGRPAATWERDGHTCVLVGDGVSNEKLAELAGWQAKGEVLAF